MTTLVLVRHATSTPPGADGLNEYQRQLTSLGLAEADALVDVLLGYAPDRILSSPYLRSLQTVRPAASALSLNVEPRNELREWDSGIEPTPDWQRHYRRCWNRPTWATGAGESHKALTVRAVAALQRCAREAPESVTVIGSHGTWISRALQGLGCDIDADFWFDMPMPAIYALQLNEDALRSVNGPGLADR